MRFRRVLPLAAAGAAAWYVRRVHRFRDPVRVPEAVDAVLSPSDGTVCFVRRVTDALVSGDALQGPLSAEALMGVPVTDGWLLGVYVGPLDVHYTYQPAGGLITRVQHQGSRVNVPLTDAASVARLALGQPADLLGSRGTLENERLSAVTRTAHGDVTMTVVAPGAGLQATPYLREGDQGRAGYKAAFLAEGGLVLLHLPVELMPQVTVGERVLGAQTVVARARPSQGTQAAAGP